MPLTRWEPFTGTRSETDRPHRPMNRLFERIRQRLTRAS
jgi:hypothetical protein